MKALKWNEIYGNWAAVLLPINEDDSIDYILPYSKKYGHSNQVLDKLLAAVGGWSDIGTRLRWPYRGVPQSEADKLATVARELIPELF